MTFVYFTDRDLGNRFPEMLRSAGVKVEQHRDHFLPDAADEEWLAAISGRGWIALTHDRRIRYKPNERKAVIRYRVALLVLIGTVPHRDLARSFVATLPTIERFLSRHLPPFIAPPFIAKVYRASTGTSAMRSEPPGRVELWYPR